MANVRVLLEIEEEVDAGFGRMRAAMASESEAVDQAEHFLADLAGFGIEPDPLYPPIPMFEPAAIQRAEATTAAFSSPEAGADLNARTTLIACDVDSTRLDDLRREARVRVWPDPPLSLVGRCPSCGGQGGHDAEPGALDPARFDATSFDLARSTGGVDCAPHRPGVSIAEIRSLLGVEAIWRDGFRGQNIVVAVVDEGVNNFYPVIGGLNLRGAFAPGGAPITSHGSMCAADLLVAAPAVKILDYPLLKMFSSDLAVVMQAALDQRLRNGTPHLTTNSYAFYERPARNAMPGHPSWDPNHPANKKVREVVTAGCPCFFAAGNCGADCPDGRCRVGSIGPGNSISGPNSLFEVITVAAVNSRHERIGYSSQGPGGFERFKPDISGYSHFFGNFGVGRPAGTHGGQQFDSGTSAATPLAAGVGALLMSAIPRLTPLQLKTALIDGAINLGQPGWDADTGFGVVNAATSYFFLTRGPTMFGSTGLFDTPFSPNPIGASPGFAQEGEPPATAPKSSKSVSRKGSKGS